MLDLRVREHAHAMFSSAIDGIALALQAAEMSQRAVQLIVGRLLTDEEFRGRFLREPAEALTAIRDQGFELASGEFDGLMQTERALWTDAAARIDRQLQRASLRRV